MVYLTDDVIKSGMTSLKVGEAQSKSPDRRPAEREEKVRIQNCRV